jgi:UDP-glucose 4-epimerase
VRAICHVIEHPRDSPLRTFNIGTRTTTSVDEIATAITDVLGFDPTHEYTGGDRGWTGDVSRMRLSIDRLLKTGWEPEQESNAAVQRAAEQLAREL